MSETLILEGAEKLDKKDNLKLMWREGPRAPFADRQWCDAVVVGSRVYFWCNNCQFWTYEKHRSQLPDCPHASSSLAVLSGLPTTIGGNRPFTNTLMSLTTERKWIEKFPPMPTKRTFVTAVCTGTDLIVAGGMGEDYEMLTTVEVLNIQNHQWSTAIDLPEPSQYYSVTVCGDQLYMLGGACGFYSTKSVYTCSVSTLLQTCNH